MQTCLCKPEAMILCFEMNNNTFVFELMFNYKITDWNLLNHKHLEVL